LISNALQYLLNDVSKEGVSNPFLSFAFLGWGLRFLLYANPKG
jgi:hypothetical protein